MKHPRRCNCITCEMRRDLSPAFWCSSCLSWQPYDDVPGAEAKVRCEECEQVQEISMTASK